MSNTASSTILSSTRSLRTLGKSTLRESLRTVFDENKDRIIICPTRKARTSAPRRRDAGHNDHHTQAGPLTVDDRNAWDNENQPAFPWVDSAYPSR